MQSRSDLWKEYAAKGNIPLETVAVIDGTEYPASSAPVIERGAFSSEPTIGGCVTASLQISILTDDEISKSAEVVIKARYVNGDEATEWLEEGTFYVSKRSKDYSSGLLSLTCYDKMLMTNKDYFDSDEEGVWPQAMSDVVNAIADWLEVGIDDRTAINTGEAYYVPCPTGLTVMQVLGHIAAAHGGNWIITPQGRLRLVPLAEAPEESTDDEVEVVAVLGALTQASDMTISGITLEGTDGTSYTAGDDSAYMLTVTELPCASQEICDDLYEKLGGITYRPYTMTQAIYDPAAEIGDTITYADQVRSILYNESLTLDIAHRAAASAPSAAEAEDEYPYLSSTAKLEKAISQVSSSIEGTATSIASSIVERSTESILATVSKTYVTLSAALTDTKAYFAISSSADEYPDLETAGGRASYAGIAQAGLWLAGYYGWIPEMPVYDDGDYVWVCYLKIYADGSTEWTEPELIIDGSLSASILTISSTTAAVKIQADAILQSITATNASWYTKDYAISVTGCGAPDSEEYSASAYKGLYYLDQETGDVYLSNGSTWECVDTLSSTTETLSSMISLTEESIRSELASSYATISYADNAASNAQEAAQEYADSQLTYYSTSEEVTNAITQAIGESESSITSQISTTATELRQYADSAASKAETNAGVYTDGKLTSYSTTEEVNNSIEQAVSDSESSIMSAISVTYATVTYVDSAASEAESNANEYTDGHLSYYSTTEEMNNAITQTVNDSINSITSEISTTYATIAYADEVADTAESNANEYTDGKLVYYSTTTEVSNAISQAITDSESTITSEINSTKTEMKTYADETASAAQTAAQTYTDGKLTYYSTTEEVSNSIEQAVSDSESSITSAISKTYATITYTDSAVNDAQTAAQNYTDNLLTSYSTTETMENAITQAIKDGTNAIMLDVSNTYATTEYAQDAADDALEAAKSYTSSTISASLALEILEAEDGTKYGAISANADYILLSGSQIEIVTDDFTLSGGNATFSGALEAASGTFAGELIAASGTFAGELQAASGTFEGELVAASGTFETITGGVLQSSNYVSGESGLYIDITNGIIECASLTAEISNGLLLTVSEQYATMEDYKTLESLMDDTVVDVQAYFAISSSADEYPDLETAGGRASYAGIARAGLWLAGYYGWIPEMPVYDDGDYVWMCHLVTYLSGETVWTKPTLIVDGSLTTSVATLKKTTASIQVLTDSILQTVTSTDSTWYRGDYVISVTSYGTPDDAGVSASAYKGLYYLDQETGYVYLSDGSTWEYADALTSTTETLTSMIKSTETSITQSVSKNYALNATAIYYGSCDTASGNPYKTVTCDDFTEDSLVVGAAVYVTFTYGCSCYPLHLNIGDAGSIEAYLNGGSMSVTSYSVIGAGETAVFIYDGEHWNINLATTAICASLVLEIATDENGNHYGLLSGNADYIELSGNEIAIHTDDFTLEKGSATFGGTLKAGIVTTDSIAAGAVTSEEIDVETLSAISADVGTLTAGILKSEDYVEDESGLCIDLDNGTITSLKFSISADGDATFSGALNAATGTFEGELQAATGTFKGELTAASGSFTGELSGATGTFGGELTAATGSFSGALDAATGTYEGELKAASGTFGTITGGILVSENYAENESGLYIDLNNGTINCASLTASAYSTIMLDVSKTYATTDYADSAADEAESNANSYTNDTVSASLVLTIVELTDGTKYGSLSGNADYIELTGDDIVIRTDDFVLEKGSATFSGSLYAATGSFSGTLDAASGKFTGELDAVTGTFDTITAGILMSSDYVENESGLCINLTEGTINCASLTASAYSTIMLEVSNTYTLNTTAVYYGTCTSASGYPYKTVDCEDFTADSLAVGATIYVTFKNGCSCYPLLLNISGTGSIAAYLNGEGMSASSYSTWESGETVAFVYDGEHWNVQLAETAAQASLALKIETDDDGKKYGKLSANADYIKFEAKEFIVDAGNFSIDADSTVKAGGFTIGETALYSGMESLESEENGVYVGTDGIGSRGDNGVLTFSNGTLTMLANTGIVCTNSEGTRVTVDDKALTEICIGNGRGLLVCTSGYEEASKDIVGSFEVSTDRFEASSASTSGWFAINNLSETVTVNGTFNNSSDARLKEDFADLSDYDAVFDALEPLEYRYKKGGSRHTGFVYQDVYRALEDAGITPEDSALVGTYTDRESGEEYGAISYTEFVALLVAQVQALKLRVTELESQRATA